MKDSKSGQEIENAELTSFSILHTLSYVDSKYPVPLELLVPAEIDCVQKQFIQF